jgi:hypothetical protein
VENSADYLPTELRPDNKITETYCTTGVRVLPATRRIRSRPFRRVGGSILSWRVNPPPGEWRGRPGSSQQLFRVEDIDNFAHTHHSAGRFDLDGDKLAEIFRYVDVVENSGESNDQLNAKTAVGTETWMAA